jgi:uncharacterized membrane protein YbaN (DUF454 family)
VTSSRSARLVFGALGSVLVGIGAVGVFVPVLPTTPFLLLAAACYVRASPRLHGWLLSHRRLGPYVSGFVDGRGLSTRAKRRSVVGLWLTIGLSGSVLILRLGVTDVSVGVSLVLLLVAVLVTRYILHRPTRPD